ncbi:hypothetical protein [Lewinella sp. LCG006]|uniref:hypothetical protein n=1 Tax=Lewinella sp. LCG006 TaxID=3231911 RepID=UPI00345F6368
MPPSAHRETLNYEERDAVISLMLKHLRNELPPSDYHRVSHIIANCEACQLLYADMQDFFDTSNAVVCETIHKEEIERNRTFLSQQVSKQHVLRPKASVTFQPYFEPFDLIDEGCFCCGS